MAASAMRLPVVATNNQGRRQAVENGVMGTSVPVRHTATLACVTVDLVNDAERRSRYGTAAQEQARREFDNQRVIEHTLEVYRLLRH